MGQKVNEPNKHGKDTLRVDLKESKGPLVSRQNQNTEHPIKNGSRVDPVQILSYPNMKQMDTISFRAVRTDEQNRFGVESHLKPPAPNESTRERLNEEFEDAKEDDDDLVAETMLLR
ncbi:hypothetical protein TSUD_277280 [Trifolium subterraneum]|uniref:Uncharacterized protein n=1 Tax=Trifolium subterraneum TaxID=3900 RepID=A0A2Z6MXT9_TRISU|nr:hypothetical protein TSUD_277280 [Trifolium subterraneum]